MTRTEKVKTEVCGKLRANLWRPDGGINWIGYVGYHVCGGLLSRSVVRWFLLSSENVCSMQGEEIYSLDQLSVQSAREEGIGFGFSRAS
jgi:hypothetical protein